MEWLLKKYDELRLNELYELLKLRASVFVVEQDCPYLDLDGKDPRAIHILGYQKNNLVAYSRIFRPGAFEKTHARIGRIVIHKQSRRKGIGLELVQKSIAFCKEHFGNQTIKISAQVYLKNFYNQCGFIEKGEIYLEDGIPHFAMYLNHTP
jgi:ElaA protein